MEVPVLMKILQSSGSIQHSDRDLFEATFDEMIRTYFVRINCIYNEGKGTFYYSMYLVSL